MPISRKELLGQLDTLIEAEVKAMSASGAVTEAEADAAGISEDFEEETLSLIGQLSPSGTLGPGTSLRP